MFLFNTKVQFISEGIIYELKLIKQEVWERVQGDGRKIQSGELEGGTQLNTIWGRLVECISNIMHALTLCISNTLFSILFHAMYN